jgi:hypothetical protein
MVTPGRCPGVVCVTPLGKGERPEGASHTTAEPAATPAATPAPQLVRKRGANNAA